MVIKSITNLLLIALFLSMISSCKSKKTENELHRVETKVSVKITKIVIGSLDDVISLNGKTVFLKKNTIISSISGYVKKIHVQYGDVIQKNNLLFEIQSKENKSLENSGLDQELTFIDSGVIKVLAPSDGIISEMNVNAPGMFVAEGSQLCTFIENKDLKVLVNVPYQYNPWIKMNEICKIVLTDSTILNGSVIKILPEINETSQTQNVLIKVETPLQIPESLNVIVQFIRNSHSKAMLIPKEALLTDEAQKEFWVMKIQHDSIAIKIPVKKGFENKQLVEIISTNITSTDAVIIVGAYYLPDSTLVKVEN